MTSNDTRWVVGDDRQNVPDDLGSVPPSEEKSIESSDADLNVITLPKRQVSASPTKVYIMADDAPS